MSFRTQYSDAPEPHALPSPALCVSFPAPHPPLPQEPGERGAKSRRGTPTPDPGPSGASWACGRNKVGVMAPQVTGVSVGRPVIISAQPPTPHPRHRVLVLWALPPAPRLERPTQTPGRRRYGLAEAFGCIWGGFSAPVSRGEQHGSDRSGRCLGKGFEREVCPPKIRDSNQDAGTAPVYSLVCVLKERAGPSLSPVQASELLPRKILAETLALTKPL